MKISPAVVALCAALVINGSLEAQGRGGRGTPIPAGETCPPGATEIRPNNCMAPQLPPPSIVDYRPRSTLVVPAHPVKVAKFPVIDFHGHPRNLISTSDGLATLASALDALNVRMMIAADNVSGEGLQRTMAAVRAAPQMKDRVRVLTGINLRNVGQAGWAEAAIAQLEADVAAGAVGVGEIGKGFGLSTRKADGTRLH